MKTLTSKYSHGRSVMKDTTVSICSIVRDCGREVAANIPRVEKLRTLFRDSEVVIFENDSKDNTKEVLRKWQQKSFNVHVFTDDFGGGNTIPSRQQVNGNPNFSAYRIDKMARYRNNYMQYLNTGGIDRDFVIVIDLDIAGFDIEGIVHSFGTLRKWDCITANGKSLSSRMTSQYHDSYALVEYGQINRPQTEEIIYSNQERFSFLKTGMPLIPVDSAFGGLAIYRWSSLEGLYYSSMPNDDPRVKSKCEHAALHKQMKESGRGSIYINPSMTLKYREITLDLILKKLGEILEEIRSKPVPKENITVPSAVVNKLDS
jgi:glycosyltransferase involved in cell wall biosynthesis